MPTSGAVEVVDMVARTGFAGGVAAAAGAGTRRAAARHARRSRTPLIFSSDSVPYVINEFTVEGSIDPASGEFVDTPTPGPRRDALPLALTVIAFE